MVFVLLSLKYIEHSRCLVSRVTLSMLPPSEIMSTVLLHLTTHVLNKFYSELSNQMDDDGMMENSDLFTVIYCPRASVRPVVSDLQTDSVSKDSQFRTGWLLEALFFTRGEHSCCGELCI